MANAPELLSALSHPTRQAIVDLLRQQPSTVGELAAQLPVTRPAVSQHLQALKSIGMVEEDRRGTRHYFRLNPRSLAELRMYIESMWRDALAGFSDFAKKETDRNAKGGQTKERNSKKHSGRLRD
jgi:DNA-binding transcriptional ArsR family regulator